jgi:hypothetical protein
MRLAAILHDLSLALLVGGIAGVGFCVNLLFSRAPSREIAGQVGNAIFGRLGPGVLALSVTLLITSLLLHRGGPPSGRRTVSLLLAGAIVAVAAVTALWLTPRMGALWASGVHAADGSGLIGDDRRRFLALHIISNVAYLMVMLMGVALELLRSWGPRLTGDR